ncbi:molecular chaperone OsmY [Crenobacter cavernae]|uniref:Osmotically-inducible protein Y n=1 Tax=Crenobacter cavernae TaxID=2290923 RepID=A0A345Y2X6_9NEIS|nr:molecular chaperone OsmY [Crenobacter cavernae]AXK38278.1 molecular chaperone OsmY [Crenobacter cavernae]
MSYPITRKAKPCIVAFTLLLSGTALAQNPTLLQVESKVEMAVQGAGAYADDAAITAKVKAALVADKAVKGTGISVETKDNVVQLSGFVDSQKQAWRAAEVAARVEGVHAVMNDLHLKAKKGQSAGEYLSDAAITSKVKAGLLADQGLKSTAISVKTDNGRVQLSGFVANQDQAKRAEAIVKNVKNVKAVKNDLHVQ